MPPLWGARIKNHLKKALPIPWVLLDDKSLGRFNKAPSTPHRQGAHTTTGRTEWSTCSGIEAYLTNHVRIKIEQGSCEQRPGCPLIPPLCLIGVHFFSVFKDLAYNLKMTLGFLVISGPLKGQKFQVVAGQTLGRLNGDIILQDPKISRKHAQVERGQEGELRLVDLASTSGIKINGKKVHAVTLAPGLRLQLGGSLLEVTDEREESQDEIELEKLQWFEVIDSFLTSQKHKIKNRPKVLAPFTPPVVLTFVRGLQFENQWVIGYGPRKVGAKSIDFPILEPQAPSICFEILPTPQGPGFKTVNSDIVLLNDKSTKAATLKPGDLISIVNCLIEVSFDEES